MENKDKLNEIAETMNQTGYTVADLVNHLGRQHSSLLNMPDDYIDRCKAIFMDIDKGQLSGEEKGKKLEELTRILFETSAGSLLDVYKNCRTSTNEIDLLIRWTDNARLAGINGAYAFMGDTFLCECKKYDKAVGVTYVGKFSSLMSVTNTDFGIMVSWEGVTGRGKWSDSEGLIKKIALREKRYIVVLGKEDLRSICQKENNVFSTLYDKYTALKNETDYAKYITKHNAEDELKEEG